MTDRSNYFNSLDLQKHSIHTEITDLMSEDTDELVDTEQSDFDSLKWLVAEYNEINSERDRLKTVIRADGSIQY